MTHTLTVLAIDIGSSSVRAALFDEQGVQTGGCAQRLYQFQGGPAGESAFDMRALLGKVCEVIDEAVGAAPSSCHIATVGMSAFWHSMVGVDETMSPTMPLLSWSDRRSGRYANALRTPWATQALHRQTGCPMHSSFWPARARWLAAEQPDVCAATRHWLSAPDYLFHAFFGELRTSVSMASGNGLFDLNHLVWNKAAIELAGLQPSSLPSVDNHPYRTLRAPYADRWQRLANIPWFPAVGDGACSNLGAGCLDRDSMAFMLGTSGSMRVLWKGETAALPDPGLWCYRVDEQRYAGGMALAEGGATAAWARSLLGNDAHDDIETQIAGMAPDTHGLTVLPYLLGARSPDWTDGRCGVIAGLTSATQAVHIYRATLESIGIQFARAKRRLDQAWPGPRRIVATGAAMLRSPAWMQILADCLGQELAVSGIDEGSLRGAALFALERGGHMKTVDYPIIAVVRPDASAHAIYQAALARQAGFDAQMAPAWTGISPTAH